MARVPRILPLIAIAIGGVVAVRAVGAAPGFLQGAKAWAEEATAAAPADAAAAQPAVKVVPSVCALTPDQLAQQAGISPAELRIIQQLSKRRGELDARDADFATTLPLMVAAEQKLDGKIQALNAIKAEVQGLLGQVDAREKAETDRLVAVYSAMRPREAAAVFNTLNDDVRLPVAAAMRPRSLAAVMAQMPPAKAQELTEKLARRFQAQQLAARAAAAGNPSLAPTPSSPAPAPAPGASTSTQPAATGAPAPNASAPNTGAAPAATAPGTAAATPARPAARPASRRPAPRPAARPRPTTPRSAAAAPAPAASSPQPYQPAASQPAATPRQSVQ